MTQEEKKEIEKLKVKVDKLAHEIEAFNKLRKSLIRRKKRALEAIEELEKKYNVKGETNESNTDIR